jgi:hypothetical protein
MTVETLGNVGDFLGGLAVIASLLYLAVQIRQNTRAVRSSSYHQAAEQTWNYCLTVAGDASLAEILARRESGEALSPAELIRANNSDQALIFGLENMLRLHEEGLVDPDVWQNLIENTTPYLGQKNFRARLAERPGTLSKRLLREIESRPHLVPPDVA